MSAMSPSSPDGSPPGAFDSLQLTHSSTVDRVAAELRRAVFDGELESGTPLREVALADTLGVSRSTLREALGALVAEGIAVREPNRGVSVASPDPQAIGDVCRARTVLEVAGVRRWHTAGEECRGQVRAAVEHYAAQVEDGSSYQLLNERHLALHLSLVGLSESPRLVAMAESLIAELKVALARIDRMRRNAHGQAGSHARLLQLLEDGDLDAAAIDLERHLAGAEDDIRSALGGDSASTDPRDAT